jgi:class 3 adenylate cyclase
VAREQRKLAAIRAADVVSYSRLMRRDESGTLARQAAISSRIVALPACQSYTTVETPNERTLLPGHDQYRGTE